MSNDRPLTQYLGLEAPRGQKKSLCLALDLDKKVLRILRHVVSNYY